jgi:hypothetical protein
MSVLKDLKVEVTVCFYEADYSIASSFVGMNHSQTSEHYYLLILMNIILMNIILMNIILMNIILINTNK